MARLQPPAIDGARWCVYGDVMTVMGAEGAITKENGHDVW
jgi:hypothetical protein